MEPIYAVSINFMISEKLLLSGFGPFLDVIENPSEILVKKLANSFGCSHLILPVEFEQSYLILKSEIQRSEPKILIMFGLASTRSKIGFEKIGLNWVQSQHADVSNKNPIIGKIKPGQELALMTDWSIEPLLGKIDSALRTHTEISFSAGSYVCNDLYFRALDDEGIDCKKLFIHIPPFDKIELKLQFEVIASFIELAAKS
jgi:pyroglutamyl-peptidase